MEPEGEARLTTQSCALTLIDSVEYPLDAAETAADSASEPALTQMLLSRQGCY
jgi:hypothetical protein